MLLCICQRLNKSIHKLAFIWLLIKALRRCQNSQICEENAKKPGQVCLFKLHVNMKDQNSTNRMRPPIAASLGNELTFTRVRSAMFVRQLQESVSIQGQRPNGNQSLNKFLEKNQCTFCSFTRSPYRPLENRFYNEKEQISLMQSRKKAKTKQDRSIKSGQTTLLWLMTGKRGWRSAATFTAGERSEGRMDEKERLQKGGMKMTSP